VASLRRNRDFVLLQAGQLLSNTGSQITSLAYPLLVLAVTHSPARAGIVEFASFLPYVLFTLPAGLVADRHDRKRLMIGADLVRAAALGSLAGAIAAGGPAFSQIVAVAFLEGTGSTLFRACSAGALRQVVPAPQLPDATSVTTARAAVVRLAGPPLGGALFGLGRALPFLADAVSYGSSILSLGAMRTPFQQLRERDPAPLLTQVGEGFRFLWGRPFLRTCAFLFGIGNFALPGIMLVLVVVGRRQGLSGAEIGVLSAAFALALLAGSGVASRLRRRFSPRTILLIELWSWLGSGLFLVRPSVYVLVAGLLPQGVAMPVTDSVVHAYRVAVTPDRLLGRGESAWSTVALLAMPLGPLAAGLLLGAVSERETVAVFTACSLALALWGTLSPSIRQAPRLDERGALPAGGTGS
jgi:MFS family permease